MADINPKRGGHPMFYTLGEEENTLYSTKHYQYATDADPMSNFRLCGDLIKKMLKPGVDPTIAAALCLMSKQIVGVYEIVGEGKTNTIESLEDKLKDIGIYSRIIRILVNEAQAAAAKPTQTVQSTATPLADYYSEEAKQQMCKMFPKIDGPYCTECGALPKYSHVNGSYYCHQCFWSCRQQIRLEDVTVMEQL